MKMKISNLLYLFLILVVILLLKPRMINNIYDTMIGRLLLISVVIFFTMNNATLGLLIALMLIIISNTFGSLIEGMTDTTDTTDTTKC